MTGLTFVAGALTMAFAVVALFFFRFWRRTSDRLFLGFAAAFLLLALHRLALVLTAQRMENTTWLFGVRLAAFLLILAAIADKNRAAR